MNIKKALEVIDKKTEYIRKNTYNVRGEDTIRVKLSDLRAVIEALGCEPIETDSQRYARLQNVGNQLNSTVENNMPQTKSMGDREELVKELKSMLAMIDFYKNRPPEEILADFVLEDRKRIIEPLINYKHRSQDKGWGLGETDNLIDKVIKNAGVE